MLSLNRFFNDPRLSRVNDAEVLALASDRSVDFSLNGQPAFSPRQKDFLSRHIGPSGQKVWGKVVFLKQVHGAGVICVGPSPVLSSRFQEADALITKEVGVPLTVRSADCLPIFIFDPQTKAVGLVHAGWRGTHKGIVKNTIQRMALEWKTDPQHLKVAFGPAIRVCCYQVGAEFKEYFPQEIHQISDEFYLDLVLANKNQLLGWGVKSENISDCGICTCCDSRFFSYRREGKNTGRMISLMMLRES